MRITVLASGSSGNATLVESGSTRILIDAGVGSRTLARKLRETGTEGLPHAILVTHAHGDHVGHAARLSRRLRVPVFATEATAKAANLGGNVQRISARGSFELEGVSVSLLPVPHDAAQVSLVLDDGLHKLGIATDLGEVTGALFDHLRDCDALLLESNHDSELLARGPYPESLKRRVASAQGHLSNAQTAELLRALGPKTRHVVLMHLSETNNSPELALESARHALGRREVSLGAAHQRDPVVLGLDRAGLGRQLSLPGTA